MKKINVTNDLTTKEVSRKYNRFSLFYDFLEKPIEKKHFKKWRKKLLQNLEGKILEIGVGTGKNLPYYNYNKIKLTAVDISEGMLNKAKELATKNKLPVNFKLLNNEILPFNQNQFNFIVVTFVLCSVPSQKNILKEMKRVLKKSGKIFLLEHVLSKNKFIAFWQNLHNPFTKYLIGVNINRDTIKEIKRSKLNIVKEKNIAFYDVFKRLEVTK